MARAAAGGRDADGAAVDPAAPGALVVDALAFARAGHAVLEGVSFALPAGRVLAVVGPSGAGKSTLLSLIAGFGRATAGRISIDGREVTGLAPADRGVGLAFDDAALHETLDVRENLESAAAALGEPRGVRRARVERLAEELGIGALLARRPGALSAGERRRVAVARVLARRPRVALLDEPFANLDRANRGEVRRLVRALRDEVGAATVVVTHDPTDALAIADDLLVLVDGRVRAYGPAPLVWSRPADAEVAQLVDDLGMTLVPLAASRSAGGRAAVVVHPALGRRLAAFLAEHPTATDRATFGVRPVHWRPAARADAPSPAAAGLTIEVEIEAHEPAGTATDLVGRCAGHPFRARLDAGAAQELPKRGPATLHAHEEDVHLFVDDGRPRRAG